MKTKTLGYPRMGAERELKRSIEDYFRGAASEDSVHRVAQFLRKKHLLTQRDAGIDLIPSADFSLYDHVLDTAIALGVAKCGEPHVSEAEEMFLLARGSIPAKASEHGPLLDRALEMTKWFDTNYHYLVPEIDDRTRPYLRKNRWLRSYEEAAAWGIETQPVLLGPVSFLMLSKNPTLHGDPPLRRLSEFLPLYTRILSELFEQGAQWVQLDEPCLTLDLGPEELAAFELSLGTLTRASKRPRLLLTTYFDGISQQIPWLSDLDIDGLHLDLVSDPSQLEVALAHWPRARVLSLGLVDGRNVWKNDFEASLDQIERAGTRFSPERLILATSCSLLHAPLDLDMESQIHPDVRSWLSFGKQKMGELAKLRDQADGSGKALRESSASLARAKASHPLVRRDAVQRRVATVGQNELSRSCAYPQRVERARERLALPALPTTTIGSFPQTEEIRRNRARFRAGQLDAASYHEFIERTIRETIRKQEELGLDVMVHGEAERNDMVEYFADNLHGFTSTENGWVQSYGTRCVKPPIIYGDIERKCPLTVLEMRLARAATNKPIKGMLTGPITMLKWSFVRRDQPLRTTALQMAWALRDEIADLEREGLSIIQVDEPALREGLPLRKSARPQYLQTAIDAFRLATGGAVASTQIHTHMCYAEFQDVMAEIIALDADVISIESARSRTELLEALGRTAYPNEIGPGVFDIHSPRIPEVREMAERLRAAGKVVPTARLWVNPDCGLKTRSWPEVTESLRRMVEAAHIVRSELNA